MQDWVFRMGPTTRLRCQYFYQCATAPSLKPALGSLTGRLTLNDRQADASLHVYLYCKFFHQFNISISIIMAELSWLDYLKMEDVFKLVDLVKIRFKENRQIHRNFLDLVAQLRSKTIDGPTARARISNLFKDHPDLILEFNRLFVTKKTVKVQYIY